MDAEQSKVQLLRIPEEERIYEREEVLGRDASSVFPTESKGEVMKSDAAKELLGSTNRFITQSELDAIKVERGLKDSDGPEAPLKPLVEVLREAKEAKEEAFQAVWRSMKTGKNRPLDEDELDFVEKVLDQERQKDRSVRAEEQAALDRFQQEVREAAERRQQEDEAAAASAAPAPPKPKQVPAPKRKPAVPLMRVKPAKKHSAALHGSAAASDSRLIEDRPAEGHNDSGKALNTANGKADAPEDGLGGLFGTYGSDSEEE